jgi:hypothetical protein
MVSLSRKTTLLCECKVIVVEAEIRLAELMARYQKSNKIPIRTDGSLHASVEYTLKKIYIGYLFLFQTLFRYSSAMLEQVPVKSPSLANISFIRR